MAGLIGFLIFGAIVFVYFKFVFPREREKFRAASEQRKRDPVLFWASIVGMLAWLAIGLRLESITDFPDAYGFHCSGRGCLYREIWNSGVLLKDPDFYEICLFIWLWSLPAVVAGSLVYRGIKKLRTTKFSIYADPQE
jgi:hypothetical protein